MTRPLREYSRKRNFAKTNEPAPRRERARKNGLKFVVQEHHASHLHYDFRLEWEGVLKSWAVPKGPSLEPGEKRLAVEVEDHPLSYASFTGTIPEGEYGAGEVFRWDSGTWEPEGDAAAGLRKGHLDFILRGQRLTGRWLLVRTRRSAGKPQWLLIKRSAETDEARKPPREKRAARQTTKRAPRKSPMPDFIEPELARLVNEPPEEAGWLHEVKFDGYRLQLHAHGKQVKILTRSGQNWTSRFPALAAELASWKLRSAILDGEAVVLDEGGRSRFQLLQNALEEGANRKVVYYAFDLLYLGGSDLRAYALEDRKNLLAELLGRKKSKLLRFSRHFESGGAKFLESSCRLHLEGMVSKRKDAPYESGRSAAWVKAKCGRRQEVVIGGYTEPKGSREHIGALLVGYFDRGQLRYAGKVGTGYSRETLEHLLAKISPLAKADSPFAKGKPPVRGTHWVEPRLAAEVSFSEWTQDGLLRAPVFLGLREDKPAIQIVREQESNPPKPARRKERDAHSPKAKLFEIPPRETITHPGKVLFRNPSLTKQDLADYYQAIAPRFLRYSGDRPLALLRCPEGEGRTCFMQKHMRERVPAGITIRSSRNDEFLTVSTAEGLRSLVQLGSLELHVQNGKTAHPTRPDQFVIDFDPGPGVPWKEVRRAAFTLRKMLEALHLESYVKVTGGKGLHVHVPIEPLYDEGEVKNFARALAEAMAARDPDRFTATMSKKARGGKIFVDYLRNGHGALAVAPYSVRARAGAPVALPVSWEELPRIRSAAPFSVKQALARLASPDPWENFGHRRQRLPLLKPATRAA